ncbi:hypothetical protein B0H66DRAFT_616973 [Apodospora peruviana]|uniref:Uncharacterized protein n=1 Tax=Apodospora peruviana TaxID=516989 RepID=A0AAE0IJV4_9PEZI|nr:hypothetical protein B0H66DRAFT_616973 [Apodospora peruviana]
MNKGTSSGCDDIEDLYYPEFIYLHTHSCIFDFTDIELLQEVSRYHFAALRIRERRFFILQSHCLRTECLSEKGMSMSSSFSAKTRSLEQELDRSLGPIEEDLRKKAGDWVKDFLVQAFEDFCRTHQSNTNTNTATTESATAGPGTPPSTGQVADQGSSATFQLQPSRASQTWSFQRSLTRYSSNPFNFEEAVFNFDFDLTESTENPFRDGEVHGVFHGGRTWIYKMSL